MGDVLAEILKMSLTLNKVASDVSMIKLDTTQLKNGVSALQTWLEEVESHISDVDNSNASTMNKNVVLRKRVKQLWSRVDDQENRGRRNNIKMIGLKEGKDTGNATNDYIEKILNEKLGLQGEEYDIERSHRLRDPGQVTTSHHGGYW